MKLTDALVDCLLARGVDHAFGLTGGAVVHIFDSMEQRGLGVTYMHHEQSAALAAVAHAKVTGRVGCGVFTTGPGATNSITGILAAWQDSIPCVFLTGQVRSQHTSYGRKVRQVGTQEVNICDIARPITKYAKFLDDKDEFLLELEKALSIATEGRPGPVLLDIPLEFQWSEIDVPTQTKPSEHGEKDTTFKKAVTDGVVASLAMLEEASKPLLVLGYGARLSGCIDHLYDFVAHSQIPFVTTWTAADIFPTDHPCNLGIIGMSGQRGANKAAFDADVLFCVGTHLSIPHTTTLFESYAPQAKKIIVNIDKDQLENLNVNFDLKIHADLMTFFNALGNQQVPDCSWKVEQPHFKEMNVPEPKRYPKPNSNRFVRSLTSKLEGNTCHIIDGGGTALYAGFQSSMFKKRDRVICSSAISAMGTGLAEAVGAAKAGEFDRYLCIIGDGSFLMNVQDLQIISQDKLNVKITVVNNNGYLAIRQTQKGFLDNRFYGTHPDWKLAMPSIEKISGAFEIPYVRLDDPSLIEQTIDLVIKSDGPLICELVVDEDQDVLFKQAYRKNADGSHSPQDLSEMLVG